MVLILFSGQTLRLVQFGYKFVFLTPPTPFNKVKIYNIPKNRHNLYVTSPEPPETTIMYLVEYYHG